MHDRPLLVLLAVLLAALLASRLSGQEQKQKKVELMFVLPDKWERPTAADAGGLQQWAPFSKQACPSCKGTTTTGCAHCDRIEGNPRCLECGLKKTAPCRACGGLGHFPDPLEKVLCPGCMGASMFPCDVCSGIGEQQVEGGGAKRKECLACKGDGGWRCTVCKGARLVEVVPLKPSVAEAPLDQLVKARAAVTAVLDGLASFEPTGKGTRKEIKRYTDLLQPGVAVLPPLKRGQSAADEIMKAVLKGEVWVGHEEREAAALKRLKGVHEHYLKHQKHLLDLCIARAEANQKVLAERKDSEKKGKDE